MFFGVFLGDEESMFSHMGASLHLRSCDDRGGLFRRALASLKESSCINLKCFGEMISWRPMCE
jgi:hypothetical protein